MPQFEQTLQTYQREINDALLRYLPAKTEIPHRLHEAMHYVTFNGGKRVRPVLVYATGQALNAPLETLHAPAAAIEMIHAYSLVHDDLPAMDDDDLRRGKPTCHKAFDEATAILSGDALLTLAFEVMSHVDAHSPSPENQLEMIALLAKASGNIGMVGGQAIDLESVGITLNLEQLKQMHAKKTGALIRVSTLLGAHAAGASTDETQSLGEYADAIGLAFQIRDDILDIEGDTATIGKPQGADIALNKPTYPALLGLDGAKKAALDLHEKALESLSVFDNKADTLRQLSAYIVKRDK
ncbi:MAG: (2E,6E)-farnesyl diphosphate synthase [Gammaproteobacteria bacterium]|nr:(2E,6E)-farnesyl diphosphate synthase [Gammaproteobacteria bacterium]